MISGRRVARSQTGGPTYSLYLADCLEWMDVREENSVHAIVTDPPYGLKEYTALEKEKLRKGRGGVWRIPPSFDGCERGAVPRFTVLNEAERGALRDFFCAFARRALRSWRRARTFSSRRTRSSLIWFTLRSWQPASKRGER